MFVGNCIPVNLRISLLIIRELLATIMNTWVSKDVEVEVNDAVLEMESYGKTNKCLCESLTQDEPSLYNRNTI